MRMLSWNVIVIGVLLIIWSAMFATDYIRCFSLKEPLFVIAKGTTADDGGTGTYQGLGYTVEVEKYIDGEGNLCVSATKMKMLGMTIAGKSPVGNPPTVSGEVFFTEKVIEVNDTYLLVEVNDSGNSGISVGAEVDVTTNIEGCPDFEAGEYARVVFNGEVMEKDPAALGKVFAIYKHDTTASEDGELITEIKPVE